MRKHLTEGLTLLVINLILMVILFALLTALYLYRHPPNSGQFKKSQYVGTQQVPPDQIKSYIRENRCREIHYEPAHQIPNPGTHGTTLTIGTTFFRCPAIGDLPPTTLWVKDEGGKKFRP